MRLSVAQTRAVTGDVASNIARHKALINLAVALQADAIFFPELSITGYEPALAKDLATSKDDIRFDIFQLLSNANKITIGIGAPTKADDGIHIHISMIVFQPNLPRLIYSKQQLHSDEFPYFINGNGQVLLTVEDRKIAPAICYESLQPSHAKKANEIGADIYIASVAKTQNGVDKALLHYPTVAKQYSMPVAMANCVGFCDNFESVGKSAVWAKDGNLLRQLDDTSEGILLFDTETEKVVQQIL